MARRRWVCPECGAGKLGPEKPRKNNVIRYCLPCSESAGVLVERSIPALDRKRAEKAARAAEKRRADSERRAAEKRERRKREAKKHAFKGDPAWLPYMVDGIDTLRLWAKIFRYLKIERPNLTMGASRRTIGRLGVLLPTEPSTRRQIYSLIWAACLHANHYGRFYTEHVKRHGRRRETNSLAGDIAVDVLGLDKATVYEAVANHRSVTYKALTADDVMRLRDLPRLAKALTKRSPSPRALTQRACLDEDGLVMLEMEIERTEHKGAA